MSDRTQMKAGRNGKAARGQALVEYVLIVVLVVFAIIAILVITGPAVGNVFSNTVYNLLDQKFTPRPPMNETEFWEYATAVAEIKIPTVAIKTNTPIEQDPNKNYPPVANTDTYYLDTLGQTVFELIIPMRGVLINDTDPNLPDIPLLLVSGNTLPSAGGITSGVTTDGAFTYEAPVGFAGFVSFTYTIIDPGGLTSTATVNIGVDTLSPPPATATYTPQPSATPKDVALTFPFYDRGDSSLNWHTSFTNVVHGPWTIEYFSNPSWSAPITTTGSLYWLPTKQTFDYNWGVGNPTALLPADNFSIRWTANNVPMEADLYEIELIANGPARLAIGGSTVLSIAGDTGAPQSASTTYFGAPPTVQMVVEYADLSGDASIKVIFNRLADKGTCGWRNSTNPHHSESFAWQDSQGGAMYQADSTCYFRLRGAIAIPNKRGDGTDTQPVLSFWERFQVASADSLEVGVREYKTNNPWTWVVVHDAVAGSNLNWRQQVFDLRNFGSQNFAGKSIELAFRVVSVNADVGDGWYLDDFAVEDNNPRLYRVGWTDNIDDNFNSPLNWRNECEWRRTTSEKHGGSHAWSDSPASYGNNQDCSLVLNGLVDLTDFSAASPNLIELTFWSKSLLATNLDVATVEWRPEASTLESDWQAFTPSGNTDPWVAKAPTTGTWTQVFVNLSAQKGERFQLRFRLNTDNDGNVADGWYLDDFELRDRPLEYVGIPFYEPFDTSARWILGGNWGLTAGATPPHYSGPYALTDSPGDAVDFAAPSDSSAELIPSVSLADTTNPVLTFWAYWKANDAHLTLEVSTNGGATWEPTPLWEKLNGADENGVPAQLAWQRFKLDLSPFIGQTIRLRFRLNVTSSTNDDGWYIDDLRIEEDDFSARALSAGAFTDTMDGTDPEQDWYAGGVWEVTPDSGVGNSRAWTDTLAATYIKPGRSILEYRQALDVAGTTLPTLYFWSQIDLADLADKLYVEISTDNGFTWALADRVWQNPEQVNLGWHRILVDLNSYKGAPFRVRFRLESMNTTASAEGWSIDNFALFDRQNLTVLGTTYADEFNDFARWVAEGNWTPVPTMWGGWSYRPDGLVPVLDTYDPDGAGTLYNPLTTSNWVGDYWHVRPSDNAVWTGSGVVWPTVAPDLGNDDSVAEINYNYQADTVNRPFANGVPQWTELDGGSPIPNYQHYLMRWQRRYQAVVAGPYRFRVTFAGGARVYINGTLVSPKMALEVPFLTQNGGSDPFVVDPDLRSYYYEENLSGTFSIRVEYFHSTLAEAGDGRIEFAFAERSTLARTSNGKTPTDTYADKHRTSLILNGLLTIPAGKVGTMGYQERYSLTDDDYAKVYLSFDRGKTWNEITALQRFRNHAQTGGWTPGSLQDWVNTSYTISDGINVFSTEQQVMLKFELDSRQDASVDEGWLIDNFQFFTSDKPLNVAPESATLVMLTKTNTDVIGIPVVVDNAGDTHTFTMTGGTQPTRGAVIVLGGGTSLQYTPPKEWTGTTSFTYKVTDQEGLSLFAVATVTVEPYFWKGVNLGPDGTTAPATTINGRAWDAMWSDTWLGGNYATNCDNTITPSPAVDANTTAMLKCYVQENGTEAIVYVNDLGGATDGGPSVFNVYVWAVNLSTGGTSGTFDLYTHTSTTHRVLNNGELVGPKGTWRRYGPFLVVFPGGDDPYDIAIVKRGSNNMGIAGIEIERGAPPGEWVSADVNGRNTGGEGTTTGGGSTVTIEGSGQEIWGSVDEFRYAYTVETGNVRIMAQVNFDHNNGGNAWASAGLMIRERESRGARHAIILIPHSVTGPVVNTNLQWRTTDGTNSSAETKDETASVRPIWLMLDKTGNVFTGYKSTLANPDPNNLADWTAVGNVTLGSFRSRYLIGPAVTASTDDVFAQATFTNIQIIRR